MAHAGLVVKFYAIVVREFHVRGGTFVWEPNVDVNKDLGMMKISKQLFQKRSTL